MKNQKIGVLYGGMSTERSISLKSGKAVYQALLSRGWNAVLIDVDSQLPQKLIEQKIDIAWIALHGIFGEDGCVQGLLEVMNIPYTGSGVQACAVSMDKIASKKMLKDSAVQLIADQVLTQGQSEIQLPLPVVVKDPLGGSSIGVWICHTQEQLDEALQACTSSNVLIEEYIAGEEITVAVLNGVALPVVAIRPKTAFFDLEAKYTEGKTDYLVPAPIPEAIAKQAQDQALVAYNLLQMQGIARADFIIAKDGTIRFLEINACPGMTATSLSPMAAQAVGISFPELVEKLLLHASLEKQR